MNGPSHSRASRCGAWRDGESDVCGSAALAEALAEERCGRCQHSS